VAEARRAWRAELAGIDPGRLVFIDETGIDTRMTRAYARAARGQRAPGKVRWGRWERLTVLGALALDGVVASRSVAAATGTAVFLAFVEQVLVPALRARPDALVVMDNLAAHKAEAVRGALDRAGLAHRGPRPRAGAAGPGAAVLLARHEPDRAGLVQAQDPAAGGRRPLEGGPGGCPRPGAGHDHRPGCAGLVPAPRLPRRRLIRKPL
jgi:hypothetical protein